MNSSHFPGKKSNWALFVDSGEKWKFGGQSFSMIPSEAATAPSAAKPSLTSASVSAGASHLPVPPPPLSLMQAKQVDNAVPIPCPSRSRLQSQDFCDAAANTPPAPPKKRHCRSLSIPGDTSTGKSAGRKWQPSGGGVWRPVGLRAHNKLCKNRNSPLSAHHHQHYHQRSHDHLHHRAGHDAHATVFQCASKVGGGAGSGSQIHRGLTAVRSSSPTFSISQQTSASRPQRHQSLSLSAAGARPVGGGATAWPLSKSEDLTTPPESPVPRPHSASSGFCESNGSLNSTKNAQNISLSSLSASYALQHRATTVDAFRMRSLSMEEPMTRRSLTMCSSAAGARSMPAIPGCNNTGA